MDNKLYEFVKRNVNLAEFIEAETNCKLYWLKEGESARTICMMPNHNDNKPSFYITRMEDSNCWLWHCFGCNFKGTIIDFCREYLKLSSYESLKYICKKYNIDNDSSVDEEEIEKSKKLAGKKKKMELSHVVTANQCRKLLRSDYNMHNKWVAKAYKALNRALNEDNIELIEKIGTEASKRINKEK